MVCAVQQYFPYLYGRHFQVVTDNNTLTALMSSKTLDRRLQGMALKLMQFDLEIIYRPDCENSNADGLSRHSLEDGDTPVAIPSVWDLSRCPQM